MIAACVFLCSISTGYIIIVGENYIYPSGQNRQKKVWRSAFFVNSTLKIQC